MILFLSAQFVQDDDFGEEVLRQSGEAPLGAGEPTQRRGVRLRRVGQDRFLLHSQEGLDFPQRLQQILQRGHAAVPLTHRGRGAAVLPVGS